MEFLEGYKITKRISSDAVFSMYEAIDESTLDKVLIKIASQKFLIENESMARILIREHELSRLFSKKNIIAKSKLKEEDNTEHLIYNIDHLHFLTELTKKKTTDFTFIYRLAITIAHHLETLHSKGYGHFNLTPSNILFDSESSIVKLINPCIFPKFNLIYNLRYIAPEQTGRLAIKSDYRSDFYSLGIILYELITGNHPIADIDAKTIYRKQITDRFPAPDSIDITIPTALSQIVYKLTSKQASNRYQNATSLKHDLLKGLELLLSAPHQPINIGSLDYISNIQFPEINSFFEKEKDEIITSIKHAEPNKISIINLSGTLSQGKDDFAKDILVALDKGKIFNVVISALPATGAIPFYAVSNILKETAYNLHNSDLFTLHEIQTFFYNLPSHHATALIKLCPNIVTLFNINIKPINSCISDNSVLQSAVRQFINFICQRTRPFVIYLENIEHMDNSSMRLFIELMSDSELKDLVVMHSTINTVSLSKSVHNKNIIFKQFEIPKLSKRKVSLLINKTFKLNEEQSSDLVDVIIEKTKGKVKQIYTLIHLLVEKKIIHFDIDQFVWKYKIDKIKDFSFQSSYETVIESNFDKLNAEIKNLLIECSLIGYIFDIRILQITHGYSIRSLSVLFRDIQHLGFVEPIERFSTLNNHNNPLLYKFNNTKVHKILQQKITSDYLQHSTSIFSAIVEICKHDESLFFFFEEFIKKNQTLLAEITSDERSSMLNFYFHKAETYYYLKKYKDAEILITYCISLINQEGWTASRHKTTSQIYLLAIKISIQTYFFAKADKYFDTAKKYVAEPTEKIPFYEVQIDSYITRGKQSEAVGLLKELFSIAKFYPKKQNSLYWIISSKIVKTLFFNKLINSTFTLNPRTKSLRKQTLHFLNDRCYLLDNHLYNYTLYKIAKDSIINGIDKHYVFPLLRYSRNMIQDPETFDKGTKLSNELITIISKRPEDYKDELHYYIKHILPFSSHKATYNLNEIIENHFFNGETSKAIEIAHVIFSLDFFKGVNLKQLSLNIQRTIDKIGDSTKKSELVSILDIIEHRTKLLTQVRKKIEINSETNIPSSKSSNANQISIWNNVTLLLYFFLMDDHEKASICAQNVIMSTKITESTIPLCIAKFYDSLINCESYSKKSITEQKGIVTVLSERLKYFKSLAKHNPDNFMHNYLILEAEYQILLGNRKKAIQLYFEAIEYSDKQNLYHMCGYAHKRLAKIYELENLKEKAVNHYIKSFNYYKFWGTEAIANNIKFEHFSIFDELEIRIYNIS